MSEAYRRVMLRWITPKGIISAALLIATVILLQIFFIDYISSHGFSPRHEQIEIGALQATVPILLLPALGVTLVILTSWMYAVDRTLRVRMKVDLRRQRAETISRIVETSAWILWAYSLFLFIPYVLGSNWFISALYRLSLSLPQLTQFFASSYESVISLMDLDLIWKFAISQNFAACGVAIFTAAYVRRQSRVKKPR